MGYGPWGRKESDTTEETARTHLFIGCDTCIPFTRRSVSLNLVFKDNFVPRRIFLNNRAGWNQSHARNQQMTNAG